jgi:Co/Zn/Cd efflux system component
MAEYLDEQLRRAVTLVAGLNLADFGIEFVTAFSIGSVALLADSADFLEDASVNLLIAVALGCSATRRARLGMLLSGVLLLPASLLFGRSGRKFMHPSRLRRHLSRWWVWVLSSSIFSVHSCLHAIVNIRAASRMPPSFPLATTPRLMLPL